ncbi:hypothetical protein BGZ61DRAFT_374032 [Ilyonectria robusta]|uniref:uncharacterized protein n=1 Tax=Ilyonectria robusta TaxID=1079257 RepID=UPI001E8D8D68|nr:uncharacterized protein BGZ61DRAFT_374032 [Ilyonectria robusta]KAH8653912.1 hypothetical protein BGZ61DRAFT_374032 [Ilyonectria robusta]
MSPPPPEPEATCYLLPGLQALDPSAPEVDLDAYTWVQPTAIEDNEVMFDGKALSTWYEEERRRLSSGGEDSKKSRSRKACGNTTRDRASRIKNKSL